VVPDIRDGHGVLIHPKDYAEKLAHGCKVAVEVNVKLWNILPHDKSKVAMSSRWWRPRDGEENGSRTYQLILKKLQILPLADVTKNIFSTAISSGKRRSSEGSSSSKRAHIDESENPFVMIECTD